MSNPSPICLVNSGSTTNGTNVSGGSTVTIKLNDSTGVSSWTISCTATDDLNTAAAVNATLVVNNATFTATYTQPNTATGSALQFTSTVNNGVDSGGVTQPTYTTTFGVWVLSSKGYRLFFPGQTNESSSQFGVVKDLNASIR